MGMARPYIKQGYMQKSTQRDNRLTPIFQKTKQKMNLFSFPKRIIDRIEILSGYDKKR